MANPNQDNKLSNSIPFENLTTNSDYAHNNQNKDTDINEWTLMIYHSGDPGLSKEIVYSLKKLVHVGTPDKVEVVALMDSLSPDLWMYTIPRNTASKSLSETEVTNSEPGKKIAEGDLFHDHTWRVEKVNPDAWKTQMTISQSLSDKRMKRKGKKYSLASPALLRNFVKRCIKEHPARHYMLILSGHGDGIIGKTLMLDSAAARHMSVPKLNWALGEVVKEIRETRSGTKDPKKNENLVPDDHLNSLDPRIDILGFDSCVMLTVEVADLLKETVKTIVASEGSVDRAGWPYHLILEYLKINPNAKPEELAAATVSQCVRYYADFSRIGMSIDMSAINLKKVARNSEEEYQDWEKLLISIKELTQQMMSGLTPSIKQVGKAIRMEKDSRTASLDSYVLNALIAAHWYSQSYGHEQYVDLKDFCEQLKRVAPNFSKTCDAVINALGKIIIKNGYSGGEFQHSHGLSLYFPWAATDTQLWQYSRYAPKDTKAQRSDEGDVCLTPFNEATGWGDFLWEMIYATRREPRPGKGELIFMPPPGYLDHLNDFYATNGATSPQDFKNNPLTTVRTTTQDHRDNPPNPRNNEPNPRNNGADTSNHFLSTVRDNAQNQKNSDSNPENYHLMTVKHTAEDHKDNPPSLRNNELNLRNQALSGLRDSPQNLRSNDPNPRNNDSHSRNNPPSTIKNTAQDHRNQDPNPRNNSLNTRRDPPFDKNYAFNPNSGSGTVPFSKIKNPALVFFEGGCEDGNNDDNNNQ